MQISRAESVCALLQVIFLISMFQFEIFKSKYQKWYGALELSLKGKPILAMACLICILVFMLVKTFVIFGGS